MNNWMPIRKIQVGTVVGAMLWIVQWVVPAWRNNVPMEVQVLIPWAAGMASAYMTKLEAKFFPPKPVPPPAAGA